MYKKFKRFLTKSGRVLRVTRKPNKQEFLTISKVSAIGILLIGLIGFILRLVDDFFSLYVAALVVVLIVVYLLYFVKE